MTPLEHTIEEHPPDLATDTIVLFHAEDEQLLLPDITLTMPPSSFLGKLAKRLHPPLITTRKDSERFLRSLQQSMQKQLDQEHPPVGNGRLGPVDSHVNAILTNPLFYRASNPTATKQDSIVSPHRMFEDAVSTGNATLEVAKECLLSCRKYHLLGKSIQGPTEQDRLVRSIERWLWSSGLRDSMEFCHDTDFINQFLDAMKSRDACDQATKWYSHLAHITLQRWHDTPEIHDEFLDPMSHLFLRLSGITLLKAKNPARLETAIRRYNAATQYISLVLPLSSRASIVNRAVHSVVRMLLGDEQSEQLSSRLYDNFAFNIKMNSPKNSWALAVCKLKHPTKPSAATALKYFEKKDFRAVPIHQNPTRNRTFALASHTINFLLAAGEIEKAQFVLDRFQMQESDRNILKGSATWRPSFLGTDATIAV